MDWNENLNHTTSGQLPLTKLELLKKYYLEVFNVEMVNTFIKETKRPKKNCSSLSIQNEENLEESFRKTQYYQMAIWIKDKNKIIFKDRILKFNFEINKTKEWIKYHMNDSSFVDLIDFQVSQYCKRYMKSDKSFNEIRAKNDNFQSKYQYENDKINLTKTEKDN